MGFREGQVFVVKNSTPSAGSRANKGQLKYDPITDSEEKQVNRPKVSQPAAVTWSIPILLASDDGAKLQKINSKNSKLGLSVSVRRENAAVLTNRPQHLV